MKATRDVLLETRAALPALTGAEEKKNAALLAVALFIALVAVRRWAGYEGFDPYRIDYNRPGIDITSEGP